MTVTAQTLLLLLLLLLKTKTRGNAVDTATWLGAGRSGVRIPAGARDFSLLQNIRTVYQAHPASWGSFPGIKRPGREANHSPLFSSKTEWSYTFTLTIQFDGVYTNNFKLFYYQIVVIAEQRNVKTFVILRS
jgi:hypothetical protein